MDLEDALHHAISLIKEEGDRLTKRGETSDSGLVFENNAALDVLTELLALTRGLPAA